jgi:hypothetical protein
VEWNNRNRLRDAGISAGSADIFNSANEVEGRDAGWSGNFTRPEALSFRRIGPSDHNGTGDEIEDQNPFNHWTLPFFDTGRSDHCPVLGMGLSLPLSMPPAESLHFHRPCRQQERTRQDHPFRNPDTKRPANHSIYVSSGLPSSSIEIDAAESGILIALPEFMEAQSED